MSSFSELGQISRRRCLQTLAVAAVGSQFAWADEPEPGDIDAHVHVWTSDTAAYPLAEGYKESEMMPTSFTPDALFAHCRPQGVKRIVLIQMNFYEYDNRYMLDSIAKHPGAFRGVAIIDHEKPGAGQRMRQLREQGVTGFRLYADAKSVASWIDSEAMAKMWNSAADTGQAMCLLANPDALPAIERMCEKFPRTRVVIDHFARIGIDGTIRPHDLDNLCRLASFPQVFVKTSAFYALGKKKPPYLDLALMIRRLRDTFGAQRLMWASDCPFQVEEGHTYAASVALVRDRLDFLTADDKAWMLRKTAETVYWS